MSDFFEGLSILQQGIQGYRQRKAISTAQEELIKLKDTELTEKDFMRQQAEIGKGLASQLAGLGAGATQLQAALMQYQPQQPQQPQYKTVEEAEIAQYGVDKAAKRKEEREVAKLKREEKTKIALEKSKPKAGVEAMDRAFGTEAADWKVNGFTNIEEHSNRLEWAHEQMKNGANVSGWFSGVWVPGTKAYNVMQEIRAVIQQSLRASLGPQFTAKEGEDILDRTFSRSADDATNLRRLNALMERVNNAAKTKFEAVQFFDKNGTLRGFEGTIYKKSDFYPSNYEASKEKQKRKSGVSDKAAKFLY